MEKSSGHTHPVWFDAVEVPEYPPVDRPQRVDVCIVGAGIAGLSTAYQLSAAGKKVLVIDERAVGGGETGRTSAHLASAIDDRFFRLERIHGVGGSRAAYQSNAAAIDLIERVSREEGIDCDFRRLDGYLVLAPGDTPELLDRELHAAHRAGFSGVERLDRAPVQGFDSGPCLRFPNQARFHPLKYLVGLARAIERKGGIIRCGSRVRDVTGGRTVEVRTAAGHSVIADAAVVATNVPSPIGNWQGIYTKQAPYRTYVVGLRIPRGSLTDALYWDTGDPYHYVRLVSAAGDAEHDVLIVGGEDHKTGQAEDEAGRFDRLEAWTRQRFPAVQEVVHRWSGQVNEPIDYAAYIGPVPTKNHENCYLFTGDSGMGLTHGAAAGLILSDLILGRENPWATFYDPARKTLRSAGEFARENLNVAKQYTDYLTGGDVQSEDDIPNDSGAVVRQGMSKLAVYRDAAGQLHRCSAVCTHLQCIVQWNDLEKSWDCPCHGSRFDSRGTLLIGPAISDLDPAPAPQESRIENG